MDAALRSCVACATALLLGACITPAEFQALERDVAALKRGQGGAGATSGDARVAELGAQVLELEREVASLRGEVEETRHVAQEALEKSSTAPSAVAVPVPGDAARAGEGAGPAPGPGASQTAIEVSEYEGAFRLYRAGDYPQAIQRFNDFLQRYPTSDYADNALFWVGECWFKLEDFERAVLTFDEVARKYPDGNKVPDAHYRQGVALIEIGRRTDQQSTYNAAAREIFEKIVNQYPNSERVPEARRQLEKLGS
jgi:tol-pal system protein YbgF